MGQAKNRGTFEERKAQAVKRVGPLRKIDERLRVRAMAAAGGAGLLLALAVVFSSL